MIGESDNDLSAYDLGISICFVFLWSFNTFFFFSESVSKEHFYHILITFHFFTTKNFVCEYLCMKMYLIFIVQSAMWKVPPLCPLHLQYPSWDRICRWHHQLIISWTHQQAKPFDPIESDQQDSMIPTSSITAGAGCCFSQKQRSGYVF